MATQLANTDQAYALSNPGERIVPEQDIADSAASKGGDTVKKTHADPVDAAAAC